LQVKKGGVMKRVIVGVVVLIISLPVLLYAAMTSQLETAYQEQYEQYSKETKSLQPIIADYETCINDDNDITRQRFELDKRKMFYQVSSKDYLAESISIGRKGLEVTKKCLDTFNRSRGEQRIDFSMHELNEDMEFSRRRVKELTGKKQELKIKILEANGTLPAWWIN
jgi:hypothetical protein